MDNTKKNLFMELERIAEAVKKYGGCWYSKFEEGVKPYTVTDLMVCNNGCIGAVGYDSLYYSINSIYLDSEGRPIISEWACDGSLSGADDPMIMLNKDTWMYPAFMMYNIESGDSYIRDQQKMLEVYQQTLDGSEDAAPVAWINARRRIGGKYYGMSYTEIKEAIMAS